MHTPTELLRGGRPPPCELGPGCRACHQQHPGCDFSLLRSVQEGNREAPGLLLERYIDVFFSCSVAKVPVDDRSDVAHDALVAALTSLPGFHLSGPFREWVRTIAMRTVADYHRRRRDPPLPLDAAVLARSDSADAELRQAEARATLSGARLTRRQRAALDLGLQHELAYAEIAALLGTTAAGARMLVVRARQRISAASVTF
jgi:RNA polymerase sigma factor (sigma-70 family)